MKIINDNGFLSYSIENNEIIIEHIEVFEKRRGTGRKLLNECKRVAIDMNLPISLVSYPQDDTISQEDLDSFYSSCGFNECESGSGGTVFEYNNL